MSSPIASRLFQSRLALLVASGTVVVASTTAGVLLSRDTARHTDVQGEKFTKGPAGGSTGGGAGTQAGPALGLTMTVDAAGTIGPGQRQTLAVTVRNPNDQNMRITGASGVVDSVSKPGCLPAWFSVDDWVPSAAPTIAPANGTAVIQMTLHFADTATNQDECKSTVASPVTIAFTLHATGVQA